MAYTACHPATLALRHTLTVAAGFWGASLLLTTLEAVFGAHALLGGLYFLSIPMLVGGLTWANGGFVARGRGPGAVLVLGAVVLCSASLIILLGLVATSELLSLIHGGLSLA